MPNFKYRVDVLELKEVHEMPGAWSYDDLRGVNGFESTAYSDGQL